MCPPWVHIISTTFEGQEDGMDPFRNPGAKDTKYVEELVACSS